MNTEIGFRLLLTGIARRPQCFTGEGFFSLGNGWPLGMRSKCRENGEKSQSDSVWSVNEFARAIVATSQLAVEVRDRIEENETGKKVFDRLRLGTARLAISAPGG
ncbi:Hypothetical predicted protein [Prunus dulcis]|uniref:Uncharacterized protein n=1 Tax=Prunus dulcis TaxID=3755 RepID=A0A5E4EG28_PRUDU|nr:Hypothetical predicted protein [Prunus dulcis]